MVGFEILVNISMDKRQEFLQTCELLGNPDHRDPACTKQVLFESVLESNQFLWVEHWTHKTRMNAHLKSDRFYVLIGAIEVLGKSNELRRLEIKTLDD